MAAEISLECDVEHLDIDLAYVTAHPLLENVHEELTILFAADRTIRYEVSRLRIEQAFAARLLTPALISKIDGLIARTLDDGDELHPLRMQLVAKKAINRATMFLVGRVDRAQDVKVNSVFAKVCPALHHSVEGSPFAAVEPVCVVDLAGTIDAEPNQKIVFLEEGAPLVIKKDSVGLKGMLYRLLRPAVFFHQLHGTPEELKLHQRRLAPLPRHGYSGRAVRLQELADVSLERGIGHPVFFVRIQGFLGQEKAIGAIDVTSGSAWFC